MIRIKVDPEALRKMLTNKRRLRRASVKLAEIIKGHISDGVDCNGNAFTPLDFDRVDGSSENPLLASGKHLLKSIRPVPGEASIGVATNFIGAALLHHGTVGKGGTKPSVVPKKAGALRIPVRAGEPRVYKRTVKGVEQTVSRKNTSYILAQKVDIHPRPFFKVSESEIHAVIGEFLK